jgi:N-acetylglucosaminyldiphosphoundecaprenol N-acetyl-beta-D-mannosaminyltransferase
MTEPTMHDRVWVWGVPFAPLTLAEAVASVSELVRRRRPSYFITANTHYVMLTDAMPDLRGVNEGAAFIVADGAPLVLASRLQGTRLPERVAGSDLIFHLGREAAARGFRIFLLGGGPGVAEQAAARLVEHYPGLVIAGTECPPFRELSAEEHEALLERIRAARPDLLIVAFTMPKGERWLAANVQVLGVPVAVNVGAAIDFAAGRVRRAPRWMQRCGLEWFFRMSLEPRRLAGRYARNAWFIARMVARTRRVRPPSAAAKAEDRGVADTPARTTDHQEPAVRSGN